MALVDYQIRRLCLENDLVVPFLPEMLNPASIDVRIGQFIKVEHQGSWGDRLSRFLFRFKPLRRWVKFKPVQFVDVDLSGYTAENPYYIKPKEFFLASTIEVFNIPDTLTVTFCLKSSRGREGFNNVLAGFGDPGWQDSVLTLELINELRFNWLPIYPGLRIGQMIFENCDAPEKSYSVTGRYNGDRTVQSSRG
jgi:dCTP deaminase